MSTSHWYWLASVTKIRLRLQSFVTDHKIYCVYVAPDEETVREHARKGGFPANAVARVHAVIEPITAEPMTA